MMKYQEYAEYKDSGVEWLGEIPNHWKVASLRFLFAAINNGSTANQIEESDTTVPISRIESISTGEIDMSKVGFVDVKTVPENFKIDKGDILLSHINSLPMVGNIALKRDSTLLFHGMNLLRLVPNKSRAVPQFLFWLLKSVYFRKSVESIAKPAINQASVSIISLKNINLLVPIIEEQIQIANFLDHETAKIDSLIEKQQQLIQLLKEKRQAVISHAVTKGLDPRVKMKDSGVEWLGEVPEHWNTLPLKLCVQTRKGVAFKAVDFCDAGIRVVKASDIKQKTIRESETFLPNSYVNEFPKAVLHTDDLILSTVGSTPDVKNSAVGQIGKVPQSLSGSLLNQNTVVFSSTEILDQNFLYYLVQTNSYRDHLDLNAHGTANQASLNISDMLNFMISIPELNEQVEIKNYLDKKISKVEELELKILAMSISLNERRTALISAAVTGKIDVRNWQNPTEAKMEFSA